MKKIASLVLIASLFYNVLGLYMTFAEQQEQMWVSAMEQTDESNFEVINVRIDPYAVIVDSGFESANENIVVDNKSYHVFKTRIQDNILKLYCLKNLDQQNISNNLKKIVKNQLFDNDSNQENPTKKNIKSFIKDYITIPPIGLKPVTAVIFDYIPFSKKLDTTLLPGHISIASPPPNMV